ncbi:MAG TPA: methyltransferase domain-containing protein [Rhizobiaceae bacterium]
MTPTTIRHDTTERHVAKYSNPNPLHRLSLNRFHAALASELRALAPRSVLDFGCGEAFTLDELARLGLHVEDYEGVDLRADSLVAAGSRWPGLRFTCADILDPRFDGKRYEVTLALEVMEHLFEPERVLERLVQLTEKALVLSVPHEPWFQLVNLSRGRDLIRLGNHPEHVQHWNSQSFADFLSPYAEVVQVRRSFPFIIATARPRR